jgi:hypothetical protein
MSEAQDAYARAKQRLAYARRELARFRETMSLDDPRETRKPGVVFVRPTSYRADLRADL